MHANDDEALRESADNNHIEVVKLLLQYGANMHAKNNYALKVCSSKGYFNIAKLLIDAGATLFTS